MDDNDFSLFTSLRYDEQLTKIAQTKVDHSEWNYGHKSPLYIFDYHRDRLLRAARHWNWGAAIDVLAGDEALEQLAYRCKEHVGLSPDRPLRLRILLSKGGGLTFEKNDTPKTALENLLPERLTRPGTVPSGGEPRRENVYTVVLDTQHIKRSEFTHFKTTRRDFYNEARARTGIELADAKEVLMVNGEDRAVMEGSTTSPYFWRNDQWVTPPVAIQFNWSDGSGGNDGTTRRMALER